MRTTLTTLTLVLLAACSSTMTPKDSAALPAAATASSAACLDHQHTRHAQASLPERQGAMEREVDDYLRLSEEALSLRAQAIRFHQELKERAGNGSPLTGEDLKRLGEGTARLLAQREALLNIAEAHECWVDLPPTTTPREAALRSAGVAMSLSAALLLYDNYLTAIAPFQRDPELRQLLNRADQGLGIPAGTLNTIAVNFASPDYRRRTKKAAEWLERQGAVPPAEQVRNHAYLVASIDQSPSLALVRRIAPLRDMASNLDFLGSLTIDGVFALKNETTNLSSLLFGNTIGLVETRRGKLHGRPDITRRVEDSLKAGDILLEKTPFRLTDTFIPGHWGHAAIWVGNAGEMRELGIWEHPAVKPFQADILAGRGVVEALRSGVQTNPMSHFLNVDDLAVLRHPTLSRQERADVILYTLRQVGKAYDFNFDAETTHRIFCSKLVYLAYGNLQWPTSRMLGRVTVSPDDIAARSVGEGPLSVALLYHDGKQITEEPRQAMGKLLQATKLSLAQQ